MRVLAVIEAAHLRNYTRRATLEAIARTRWTLDVLRHGHVLNMIRTSPGDGPVRGEVEQITAEEGLQDQVALLGYLSHEEFIRCLYDSDIFLAPSITASDGDTEGGSPVSITEAAASGLPVVSSRHADIPQVVVHERSGFLAAEKDLDALADYLYRLVASPELRQAMGQEARKHVESCFDLRKELRELERHYREVLGGTRSV